jgi:hydroxymethylpyrimidine pyrophosphatase-like HAD family hydrolase
MRFGVLALDYDGTIAQDGVLDPDVRQAILEVRAHGVTVVIVTGRILDDLRRLMGDLRLVDAVVAENGAVIAFPASGRSVVLAPPASESMLMELRQRGIEARAGASGSGKPWLRASMGRIRRAWDEVALEGTFHPEV